MALVVSGTAHAVQFAAYRKLLTETMLAQQPTLITDNPTTFKNWAYRQPDQWLWHPEARGISRMGRDLSPASTPGLGAEISGHLQDSSFKTKSKS